MNKNDFNPGFTWVFSIRPGGRSDLVPLSGGVFAILDRSESYMYVGRTRSLRWRINRIAIAERRGSLTVYYDSGVQEPKWFAFKQCPGDEAKRLVRRTLDEYQSRMGEMPSLHRVGWRPGPC